MLHKILSTASITDEVISNFFDAPDIPLNCIREENLRSDNEAIRHAVETMQTKKRGKGLQRGF
jgi:hypothetical protein